MKIHESYINRCLQLAKNGLPAAMPNPSVGAVLVQNNRIIAEGFTSAYGGAHAEVNCISFAKANYPELISKSTLYVSLEPCSHYGKTPPCADLIIANGIKKVVIGTIDPFAKVAGAGIKKLMEAGCEVIIGVLEAACRESNRRFFTFHEQKRPYIVLKWAQTLDGYIAPESRNEQAPVWITGKRARQLVHKWRSEEQAILVGANTVKQDNPSLTTRDWDGSNPLRVVLDARGNLEQNFTVFDDSADTLVLNTVDVQEICNRLFKKGAQSIIIEGGSSTLQDFIDTGLWDEARVFYGDTTFGGGTLAPKLNANVDPISSQKLENDTLHIYKNIRS